MHMLKENSLFIKCRRVLVPTAVPLKAKVSAVISLVVWIGDISCVHLLAFL